MKRSLTFAVVAICAILAGSCKKDDTIQYNNITMGNVTGGRFVSDNGNIFNVVEQNCAGVLDTMQRAIVLCDILNRTTEGSEYEYDIRLNDMAWVLTKEIIPAGTLTEEDADKLVEDPISIEDIWISGGYLNIYIVFPVKTDSKTSHMINLVETENDGDGYSFTLRHNAFTETLTPENSHMFQMGGGYVSFPLSTFITESKADIKITWKWHKTAGNGLSTETEFHERSGTYEKGGHDNVPKGLSLRNMTKVLQN